MNINLYVLLVVLLGLALSRGLGRLGQGQTLMSALFLAFLLGILLTFPMLYVTIDICRFLGVTKGSACVETNDQTVWNLAFPLLAFPLYAAVMRLRAHA